MRLNKKGLTIAEAVISMVLLAVVTMGIYSVIMTTIRTAKKPDMREDMALAVEQATARLKTNIQWQALCRVVNPKCTDPVFDNCCLRWDACLDGDPDNCGSALAPGWVPQDGYRVVDNKAAVLNNKVYRDLCGGILPNASAVDATSGIANSAKTPFNLNTRYDISSCFLPDACKLDGGIFTYTVDGTGNITFNVECSGGNI